MRRRRVAHNVPYQFIFFVKANLLCFLLALALHLRPICLSAALKASSKALRPHFTMPPQPPVNWFKDCVIRKDRDIDKLYVMAHGVARKRTMAEYNYWKPGFSSWANAVNIPGLLKMATSIVKFDADNRITASYDGAPALTAIDESIELKKFVLKIVAESAGSRLGMKKANQMDATPDAEIETQFRGLTRLLAEIAYCITQACSVPETGENVYSELREVEGNITVLEDGNTHPLAAFIMLSWIENQASVDPSGTGMHQRESMEKDLLKLQDDITVTLHDLRQHLDDIKQRVIAISARDPQQGHAANVSAQEKFGTLAKSVCRRTERDSSGKDEKMQNAADVLRQSFLQLDMDPKVLSIHDFHVKVTHIFCKYLPAQATDATDASGARAGTKRGRTETQDHESSSFALLTEMRTEVKGLRAELANKNRTNNNAGNNNSSHGGSNNNHRNNNRRGKIPALGTPANRPVWFVCKRCCLTGHDDSVCTNAPCPNAEEKFRQIMVENRSKQAQRSNAYRRNTNSANSLPLNQTRGRQAGQGGNLAMLAMFPFLPAVVPLDEDDEDASDVGNFAAANLKAMDLFAIIWPAIVCAILMAGTLAGATMCNVPVSSAYLASAFVGGLLCIFFPFGMAQLVTKLYHTHITVKFLIILFMGMHGLQGTMAAPREPVALMLNASELPRVWIDSACNQTLFGDKDLLVNVRKIRPRSIGGAQTGSKMICHHRGDYPLLLQDEFGVVHCRMIRDVLVSKDTNHNLLSLHDMRDADVGFIQPPNKNQPVWITIMTPSGTEARFEIKPVNKLYPVPRWDLTDYPMGELLTSSSRIFAGMSIQQRMLTLREIWHHRLGHAHPSKIAKLSQNCTGIKEPIADTRQPCHTCMDANIIRNPRPPPAVDAPDDTWNLDTLDMGANTLSMAGFRHISIFTIVKSRYVIIILHKTKAECPEILRRAFAKAGKTPKLLRTDGAKEYNTPECNALLLSLQIRKETSNPDEQFQNGMAETMVRTIAKGIRAALLSSNLPPEFWGFAAVNWVDVYNHLPHSSIDNMTPWQVEKGTKPDVSMFRPFGCRVTVFRGREARSAS